MPRFYSDISGAVAGVKQTFMLDIGDETTNLTTGTAKKTFRFPYDFNIDDIRVNVNTAPVGSTIIVDVNLGGTSIFNAAKLSIDASEETSKTAAAAYSLKTSAIDSDDEITVDIDQIGSSTAGKGLKLIIVGTERTSEPTYTLSCNVTDVDEGSAAVFTLNTKNVADTTTVPWVISGVASGTTDITEGLTGNFTISSGTATQSITPVADTTTEGGETMVMTVKGQTVSIDINDTSVAYSNAKSIAFDGTNDVLVMAEQTYDLGSWSIWMKTSDTLHVCFSAGHWYYFYSIYGALRFAYRGGWDNVLDTHGRIDDGNWHHYVITLERDGELGVANTVKKFYIDGDLESTKNDTLTYDLDNTNNQQLKFADTYSGWQPLAGNIDEVGWWDDSTLTAAEVTALYNSGTPIDLKTDAGDYASSGDLTSYWRMGDGDSHPTIEDNKGSNDGTMTNMDSGDLVEDVPSA